MLNNKLIIQVRGLVTTCLFIVFNCKGQVANYVNNGSFELTTQNVSITPFDVIQHWAPINPNKNATFLCSLVPPLSNAPYCGLGFQFPRTGNNFIATQFYCTACVRWYPRNILKQTLKPNTVYCGKYFVVNTNNNRVGIDSYGMYFGDSTTDTISQCHIPITYLSPQIQNANGNIITDTLNWTPITGTFTANGTEKYLILGN